MKTTKIPIGDGMDACRVCKYCYEYKKLDDRGCCENPKCAAIGRSVEERVLMNVIAALRGSPIECLSTEDVAEALETGEWRRYHRAYSAKKPK